MGRRNGYFRYQRHRAIARKKWIAEHAVGCEWYAIAGKYSKGKIHCGCSLCKPRFRTVREERENEIFAFELREYLN